MERANLVVHNAAWHEFSVTRGTAARMHKVNVEGTKLVFGTALDLGGPRAV